MTSTPSKSLSHTRILNDSEQRLAQRYLALADAMPQLVWATDANGSHFYFNERWYEYTGLTEEQSLGFGFTNALHPDDLERTLERWQLAWQCGQPYEIEYRFRRHDGVYHWFIGRAMPVRDDQGTIVEWVGTCTDIDEQKRSHEILQFQADASTLLSETVGHEEALRKLAQMAVPGLADWCAIDIYDGNRLRRLAVAHVDPAKVALAHELQERVPFDPHAPTGVAAVLRTGKPELITDIDEQVIRATVADPQLQETLIALGLCSSLTVPLQTRTRILGAFTFVSAESRRRFTANDVRLAIDIGRRAANTVEQAWLYQDLREFRTTLDNTRDAVLLFDPATLRFFYVNQGAIDQLGYTQDELLTMTPLDIKPEFNEERYRHMLAPLISGELQSYTFETIHRHKSGILIDVEVSLQHVTHPAMPGRFVTVVRDISERKRTEEALRASERRFRHLADSMPMHVWITNVQGNGSYYNRRWLEYTGLTQEEASAGGGRELIHPDDRAATMERWTQSLQTGTPFEHEYRLRGAKGQYRWFLLRALPYNTDGKTIGYWVGTSTDIDEQKRNVASLQERREELERLTQALADRNRELDQFAYITSHDLKAPLRGIGNLAQWIEEDLGENVSSDVRSYLELLRGRVLRMEALIDGILQFSRVGRISGNAEQVDTGELVRDVIDLLAPPANVTIEVAPDLPTLHTYRLPLTQVFSNLIGNAVKHNADRPLHISVNAQPAGRFVEFSVRDDGQGIAPQYQERVFGIFQTLASRDKVEGSGLGLALVKKIVEHTRGRVRLESDEGAGATFSFTWPRDV